MLLLLLLLVLVLLVLLGRVIRLAGGLLMDKGETGRRWRRKQDRRTRGGRMVVWLDRREGWWEEFFYQVGLLLSKWREDKRKTLEYIKSARVKHSG